MEKESSSEGEQLSLKKKGKVVCFSTLSSMMERVVERAVETKIQQVLPTVIPPGLPCKATKKSLRRTEISFSEEDSGEDQALPSHKGMPGPPQKAKSKRTRVPSSGEDSEEERAPPKVGKVSSWLGSVGDGSLSHHSASDKEGELSEDEDQTPPSSSRVDRLCPIDLYHCVMLKAAKVIDLPIPETAPQVVSASSRAKTYPQGPPKTSADPFP